MAALAELRSLVCHINQRHPAVPVLIDLCELRGYRYHTGVVFSAYHSDAMTEIARGGRYDNIGAAFGRARPATGFSCDLKQLSSLDVVDGGEPTGILAPEHDEPGLWSAIAALREQGERVVVALSTDDDARTLGCDRTLVFHDGHWTLRQI
ncbi:MAG: ATP phosphoribosyltransferase regulatory subunit [Pseudomonadota bacterium]